MTTASDGVALVATHLAHIDRRTLSQAWYSTLHVASQTAPRGRSARRNTAVVRHVAPAAPAPRAVVPASSASTVQPQRTPAADPRAGIVLDRRGATCEMTRRIERTVAKLAAVPKRRSGAQTLDVAGGRIRLLVRTDGRSTRIVALCAVPLRERVERALAHARFTLAASGMAVAQ